MLLVLPPRRLPLPAQLQLVLMPTPDAAVRHAVLVLLAQNLQQHALRHALAEGQQQQQLLPPQQRGLCLLPANWPQPQESPHQV